MDGSDLWNSRLSFSSRRYPSRSEVYLVGDDIDVEDELKQEFLCPFCAEEFDTVGLFCHVEEEHPVEVKHGVCPVCAKRVGMDMVSHITNHHGNILKVQRKRRLRRGGTNSMLSILRKELKDNRQSLFEGTSYAHLSSNPEPDPLVSSLIYNSPIEDILGTHKTHSSVELVEDAVEKNVTQRMEQPQLSVEDQKEKCRKSEFVQGLLLSAMFDDIL